MYIYYYIHDVLLYKMTGDKRARSQLLEYPTPGRLPGTSRSLETVIVEIQYATIDNIVNPLGVPSFQPAPSPHGIVPRHRHQFL